MFERIIQTGDDKAVAIVRIALGLAILPHGAQKLLGWFGGGGVGGTIDFFSANFGVPAFITLLIIAAEFFGPFGLIFGFLSRVAAFGVLAVMVGAVLMVHLPNGFFMNWTGAQAGEGFEYHLLAVGMALAVLIRGSGWLSVDGALSSDRTAVR